MWFHHAAVVGFQLLIILSVLSSTSGQSLACYCDQMLTSIVQATIATRVESNDPGLEALVGNTTLQCINQNNLISKINVPSCSNGQCTAQVPNFGVCQSDVNVPLQPACLLYSGDGITYRGCFSTNTTGSMTVSGYGFQATVCTTNFCIPAAPAGGDTLPGIGGGKHKSGAVVNRSAWTVLLATCLLCAAFMMA